VTDVNIKRERQTGQKKCEDKSDR